MEKTWKHIQLLAPSLAEVEGSAYAEGDEDADQDEPYSKSVGGTVRGHSIAYEV